MALATVVETSEVINELLGKKLLVSGTQVSSNLQDKQAGISIEKIAQESLKGKNFDLCQINLEHGNIKVMVECLHPVAKLLVLGGGHVSLPLVKMASLLQYQITVIDDRPAFANPERFSGVEVICEDFITALERQPIDSGTSVVIVTRGHRYDLACLEYVLRFEPGYVGMIGSRRRVKLVREHLINSGFSIEMVDRVHMPIGLSIGAQSPEEIAVSIAGQLVEARRGKGLNPMPPTSTLEQWELIFKAGETLSTGQPVVCATIIATKGSTPRKAGAKMLVLPGGTCLGTIGGGCGEAAVKREALMLFDTGGARVYRVMLDAATAEEEGMVCGGRMDVFLERLD